MKQLSGKIAVALLIFAAIALLCITFGPLRAGYSQQAEKEMETWLTEQSRTAEQFLAEHQELLDRIAVGIFQLASEGGYDSLEFSYDSDDKCTKVEYSIETVTEKGLTVSKDWISVEELPDELTSTLSELNKSFAAPPTLRYDGSDGRVELFYAGQSFPDYFQSFATVHIVYQDGWRVTTAHWAMAGL